MDSIELGSEVKDKVTGFTGIVIGYAVYLFGCTQYGIASKSKSNRQTEWFDEGRLEVIGKGIIGKNVKAEKPGAEYNADSPK